MKKYSVSIVVTSILFFVLSFPLIAKEVGPKEALMVVNARIKNELKNLKVKKDKIQFPEATFLGLTKTKYEEAKKLEVNGMLVGYLVELEVGKKKGYMVISSDTDLTPIITYSFFNPFAMDVFKAENDDPKFDPMIRFLKEDLVGRANAVREKKISAESIKENNFLWEEYVTGKRNSKNSVRYYPDPAEYPTPTGGWLKTAWGQRNPYDKYVPMDPVTNKRSAVGCMAISMCQILYHYKFLGKPFKSVHLDGEYVIDGGLLYR